MFEKGEYVVYGSKGVCLIQDIAPVDIPGVDKNRLYYIMRAIYSGNSTVYLPTDSSKAVIRRIMTKEEANQLILDMPGIEELRVTDEKLREDIYKKCLRSCDGRTWVSIIKTLYQRKQQRMKAGKKITSLDERYLKAAEQELYGELSVALDIPKREMVEYIQAQIEKIAI